jgi:DNA-binding beta-propeller fold protein YncE
MLYRVTEASGLDLVRDIELEGRPVALATTTDRLFVLVRPNNDARHVEEGWWETFDLAGKAIGSKVRVGFYPDDLAITPDGRHALVLTSGRGEGGDHRPKPSLSAYDLGADGGPKLLSRLDFDEEGDDPARLALSDDGTKAAVSLQGTRSIAWVDLARVEEPRLIVRRWWAKGSSPDALRFDGSGGLLAVDEATETLWRQARPESDPVVTPIEGGLGDALEIPGRPDYVTFSQPFESGIGFLPASAHPDHPPTATRLPLKGRANLAPTRPLGLAYDPVRGLLAVANRSGGSIHLVALTTNAIPR